MLTYEGYKKYALSCTVQSNPVSKITWYIGNKEITASGNNSEYDMEQKIISQNDKFTKIKSTLTFKNVTRYYNGFWICAAVNEILGKTERNINMTTQLIVMCMFIVFVAVLDQEKRDFPAFGLNTERYSG